MTDDSPQVSFSWADIMACTYCQHYVWVGTHGAMPFCQNEDSPFYNPSAPDIGTKLTTEQKMGGCEKLLFNEQQIPPEVFKHVTQDSQLRKLDPEKVVAGYSGD